MLYIENFNVMQQIFYYVKLIGNSCREQFIYECSTNQLRFEKPIKRNAIIGIN